MGINYDFRRIEPKDLRNCDAVITIGKTVQYALAMKRPVYCYDRFGGPGWLDHRNVELAAHYNFSGRCCSRRIAADEIVSEIVQGYSSARMDTDRLFSILGEDYLLNQKLDKVLEKVERLPRREFSEILGEIADYDLNCAITARKLIQREYLTREGVTHEQENLKALLAKRNFENQELREENLKLINKLKELNNKSIYGFLDRFKGFFGILLLLKRIVKNFF